MNTSKDKYEDNRYSIKETLTNMARANENARKLEEEQRKNKNLKLAAGGGGLLAGLYLLYSRIRSVHQLNKAENAIKALSGRVNNIDKKL